MKIVRVGCIFLVLLGQTVCAGAADKFTFAYETEVGKAHIYQCDVVTKFTIVASEKWLKRMLVEDTNNTVSTITYSRKVLEHLADGNVIIQSKILNWSGGRPKKFVKGLKNPKKKTTFIANPINGFVRFCGKQPHGSKKQQSHYSFTGGQVAFPPGTASHPGDRLKRSVNFSEEIIRNIDRRILLFDEDFNMVTSFKEVDVSQTSQISTILTEIDASVRYSLPSGKMAHDWYGFASVTGSETMKWNHNLHVPESAQYQALGEITSTIQNPRVKRTFVIQLLVTAETRRIETKD